MQNVTRIVLENGLKVLIGENHASPVVALQAWVGVGSADETDVISGMAHLHEHMLFKGTAKRPTGDIASTVESAGGDINAWTSFDETVYHLALPASEYETGIDILTDVLQHSAFDADELAREVEVVVEEIKRAQDTPSRRLSYALFETMYLTHAYRRPVLGTEASVRSFSRDTLVSFYKKHYVPDNITFVVVGDVNTQKVLETLRRYVLTWDGDRGGAYARDGRIEEKPCSDVRVRKLSEDVEEARVAFAWHIPHVNHPDVPALDALSLLLGGGESSRLFLETRRRLGLVNGAYAHAYTPKNLGMMMVGADLPQASMQEACKSLLHETYRLRATLVSESELDKVKMMILSDAAYERETAQGMARKLGFFESIVGDYVLEEKYREAISALMPSDLRRVAKQYLHESPSVVMQVSQKETCVVDDVMIKDIIKESFREAGHARVMQTRRGSYDVTEVVYDSGVRVLVRPEEDTPVVSCSAAVQGGLRNESRSNNGLHLLLASVWGLASQNHTTEELSAAAARLGGSLSAFSGRSSMGMRASFVAEKAMPGLALFAEALLHPVFDATDVLREKTTQLESIKNRNDNPGQVASEIFLEALFDAHPYGLSMLGTHASVSSFEPVDIEALWHASLYERPLTLVVVGKVEAEAVLSYFDDVFHHETHVRKAHTHQTWVPTRVMHGPVQVSRTLDKKQTHIFVGSLGVSLFDKTRYALSVLTSLLSGQSGRLFLDLRDKQSLAYSVGASSFEGIDTGFISLYIGTSPDKREQALHGLYGHLNRLREEKISSEELARTQRYLCGNHAIELQRSSARSSVMALQACYGMPYDNHEQYASNIMSVTASDVLAAAQRYLDPSQLVEAVVGA